MYQIERVTRQITVPNYLIHLNGDVIALAYTEEDAKAVQKALNDDLQTLASLSQSLSQLLTQ